MDPQHEPPQTSNPLVVRLKKNRITDHEGEKKSPNDLVIDLPSEPDLNQRHRDAELIQSQKNRITELENEHQRDAELIQWQKSRITKLDDEIKAYEDLLAELPTKTTWNQLQRDDELIQSQKNRIAELENEHQRDAEMIQWQKSRITKLDDEIKAYEDLLTELPTKTTWNQLQRDDELIRSQKNRIAELGNEHQRDAEMIQWQKSRITKLDDEIKAYEDLLAELPEVFERSFQQRLEPLMERYQLLAEQVDTDQIERSQPALPGSSEPDNAVRFPGLRLLNFLQKRQRSA